AFLWAGSAALVQIPVGDRRPVGPGDASGGAGLLPLDAGGWQAVPATLAQSWQGRGTSIHCGGLRAVGAGALRDGAALLLRVSPGRGQWADYQPVPAGPGAARWQSARSSQPDGAVSPRAGRPLPAEGRVSGSTQRPG